MGKIVATLIILLAISSFTKPDLAKHEIYAKPDIEFIESSCGKTAYPELCVNSLPSHANAIQNSPMLLANTSLSITLETAKSTSGMILKLLTETYKLHRKEKVATRDCLEEITDSVDELQKALGEMTQLNNSSFRVMMSDIQTWVSAALTNEDTCRDGFAGLKMNEKVKNEVRQQVLNIIHLTSNALALVNNYASLQD